MPGTTPDERPDPLLERLREGASGDAALRQLRRRYDILRNDYESLVDRLMDLEDRIAADDARRESEQLELPSMPTPGQEPVTVAESVLTPVLRLRDEYLQAATGIQGIISGLDQLAAAAFRSTIPAQSAADSASTQPPAASPAASDPAPPAAAPPSARAGEPIQVEVTGEGFGELLDFQERLSRLPGVARVSISAIDTERATLVVELDGAP